MEDFFIDTSRVYEEANNISNIADMIKNQAQRVSGIIPTLNESGF